MNEETNLKKQKQNKKILETPTVNSLMRRRDQKRYYRAIKQLGIIKQKERNGIAPKTVGGVYQQMRMTKKYNFIIGRYMRKRAKKAKEFDQMNQLSQKGQPITTRPFNEVITDPLCVALGGKRNGSCLPIRKEWPSIKSQLNGLVTSYIMENKDSGPLPSYDSQEVHRGFRVIKCMDEFSKEFLFECLNTIQENWKDLNLVFIPAADIPEEKLPPIDLQQEFTPIASMNNSSEAADVKLDLAAAVKPEKSSSLARKELAQTKGNKQFKTQNYKNASNFRGNEMKTTRMHDLSMNKPENFPGKQYMTEHPQTSRNNADFPLQNRSYPSGKVSFNTSRNYDQTNEELPSTSWQNKNCFNSRGETDFNERLPASNETSWRSGERDLSQTHMQTNFEDWRGPSDFNPNSGSNISQCYQDSSTRYSDPYTNQNRNERFPTSNETSRRNMERNPALMNSGDWQRSNDLYLHSGSQLYQDSSSGFRDNYRNRDDRLPASYETSRRSSERNPSPNHQMLMNSEDWCRSTDLYANSSSNKTGSFQDSPPRHRSPFRNRDDRLPGSYESRSSERNWSQNWRRSPEFNANSGPNVTQYYQDSPSHYSNSSRTAEYNMRSEESYRNNQFHEVTPQQNFEHFPNYSSQRNNNNNNNSFSRHDENYFPRDDNEIPPPPPRWRDFNDERNNRIESPRSSSHRSRRRSSRSRRSRRN